MRQLESGKLGWIEREVAPRQWADQVEEYACLLVYGRCIKMCGWSINVYGRCIKVAHRWIHMPYPYSEKETRLR